MLAPALEVLCHLLLLWLSGTDLCGRAETRSLWGIKGSGDKRLRKGLGRGRGRTAGLPLGIHDCRQLLIGASTHVPNPASESWGIHTDRPRSQTSPQEISPLVLMRNSSQHHDFKLCE